MEKKGQENLIPMNKRTMDEQKKIAKKGGIASGISRRNKKTMREMLEIMLQCNSEEGITYQEKLILGLINSASSGNVKSIELILKMIDEVPKETSILDEMLGMIN